MPSAAFFAHPNSLAIRLADLSPNHALVLASVGICLIFLEFNRPGRVLPGALGLTLFLLSAASLSHHPLNPKALLGLASASVVLTANVWKQLPLWLAAAATAALVASLRFLVPESTNPHISTLVALTCGLAVGLLGTFLSGVALRARRLKAVH